MMETQEYWIDLEFLLLYCVRRSSSHQSKMDNKQSYTTPNRIVSVEFTQVPGEILRGLIEAQLKVEEAVERLGEEVETLKDTIKAVEKTLRMQSFQQFG